MALLMFVMRRCRSIAIFRSVGFNQIPPSFSKKYSVSNVGTLQSAKKIDISCPTYILWGSNTNVGKTLVSCGLSFASANFARKTTPPSKATFHRIFYLKPVQTGFPRDSDARFVAHQATKVLQSLKTISANQFSIRYQPSFPEIKNVPETANGVSDLTYTLTTMQLRAWKDPVSPHLAVQREGGDASDKALLLEIQNSLLDDTHRVTSLKEKHKTNKDFVLKRLRLIETAGGVSSPCPSGSKQSDFYRNLRYPGVLVGDGDLGGISATVCAYESLVAKGFDVPAVVLFDKGLKNEEMIQKYINKTTRVFLLQNLPPASETDLLPWFHASMDTFSEIATYLEVFHEETLQRLSEMRQRAEEKLWWPFTQHDMVKPSDITVIDSRLGHEFTVFEGGSEECSQPVMSRQVDACASWWTQGPNQALQSELAKSVAYATSRYGHVIFPQAVHEPALKLAEMLLDGVGNSWADRVFYTDNGSTAVEVALRMGLRKYCSDWAISESDSDRCQPVVIALQGSYHGDTLGAMMAQAPSPYTGFTQHPWYEEGKGIFLEAPQVFLKKGRWCVEVPGSFKGALGLGTGPGTVDFEDRGAVFDSSRDGSQLAGFYRAWIEQQLDRSRGDRKVPAVLIIEPVVHGASGMHMVDPLFQRCLVASCRSRRIPVVFDEVFVGCWRLGVEASWKLLGCFPDIACYAKLLTGGTVPLAATLASEAVFNAFRGDSKLSALLHGHSYTAHPIGCSAAITALSGYRDPAMNPNYIASEDRIIDLWNQQTVAKLSWLHNVTRVVSIGSVLAVELKTGDPGYGSVAAKQVLQNLRLKGIYARPLGNVIYFMCGPMTNTAVTSAVLVEVCTLLLCRSFFSN